MRGKARREKKRKLQRRVRKGIGCWNIEENTMRQEEQEAERVKRVLLVIDTLTIGLLFILLAACFPSVKYRCDSGAERASLSSVVREVKVDGNDWVVILVGRKFVKNFL
jgi:hypothetical protein